MITGTITDIKQMSREPYEGQSRYSPNTTRTEEYLRITLESDGISYQFNTPAATKSVAIAPKLAVVMYRVENGAAEWMTEIEGNGVATAGQKNTNGLRPTVMVGDTVTVKGRMGAGSHKLTHVKRIS